MRVAVAGRLLPPRVVAVRIRRLGQDPTTDGSTDTSSTDTSSTDTSSTDTSSGSSSGSGSDWLTQAGDAISSWFGGGSSNSGGSTPPATNDPSTGNPTATDNAAVPVVAPSAPAGVSPTVIALGVGAVAVTGIAIYAATRGGRSRRRNPVRRRNALSETMKGLVKRVRAASSEEAALHLIEAAYKDGKITRVQLYELERVAYASHSQDW